MAQNASTFDSSEKADSDQRQKTLEYQNRISAMEAAGEIDHLPFDDFIARLEDLEKLQYLIPEAAVKNQIQTLKMEMKFLKAFSKCIARNENLKDRSASAISAIKRASWGLFSKIPAPGEVSIPVDAMSVLFDALEAIVENRQKIRYFYEQVCVSSDSYIHMTSDLVSEFIDDLMQNLKDLLRCKAALVVSFKSQIVALQEELQFLRNFLNFVEKRCSEQEGLKDLLTHSEVVAIDLARLSYTFLSDKMNEAHSVEMNLRLSDLLQKMKATKPGVREIYIRVLKASQFSESSDDFITDKHVLGAFVDSLQHYLREILNSKFRFKRPIKDLLKILDEKLRFMRILLMDPPRQYIDMRSIDAVTSASGLLLFSLNVDEMTDEIAVQMNLKLVNLLETMIDIEGLAKQIYLKFISSRSKLPMTDGLSFIQSFVENLKELLCCSDPSITFPRSQIEKIQRDFDFFISPLRNMEKQLDQREKLKSLWTQVIELAYKTEYVIDSFLVNNGPTWCHMLWLSDVIEKIQTLKSKVIDFTTKMAHDTGVDNVQKPSSTNALSSQANTLEINERMVGFEDEKEKLIVLLMNGSSQLDVVSLVGMAGLGKTTLSKKIFNSDSVEKHFHVRGWCTVSEVYRKKDILISLLNQVSGHKHGEDEVDVEVLEQDLYQSLKGRKYLIVLDDIWSTEAWLDLKASFPDDENGSRIMFTTRNLDVAVKAKLHSDPHSLRPFRDDECWRLLQLLVFLEESCPMKLEEIGKQIAKSCKGVPLSVALIAGILATDKTKDFWSQVSQNLISRIFNSPERHSRDIIEMIEISYKHLPHHLRPCFLYFGAFLEDQEIPVKKLIRLWNAEGFVRKHEGGSIEKTAEDYLKILVSRSLVSISRRKADGGIKECRVHDLLFHFCKVKSREENFWQFDGFVSDYGGESDFSCPATSAYEQHRLCIYYQGDAFMRSGPSGSHVRSLLLHTPEHSEILTDISCISNSFKLLKVLDLESIDVYFFPDGLAMLVLLKYLALRARAAYIVPASIGSLWNLETFILIVPRAVILPETIWKLRKLRHLYMPSGFAFDSDNIRRLEFSDPNMCGLGGRRQANPEEESNQQMLDSLETISNLCLFPGEEENAIRKMPNVRKLRCSFLNYSNDNHFPNLDLLSELESLRVFSDRYSRLLHVNELISFPSKLKKLSLTRFILPSAEIAEIARLENLEVLKLQEVDFEEHRWDMVDEEFSSLRHLELRGIDVKEWNASGDNFPRLQRLRLLHVYSLREVPSCFGSVQTLEILEVKYCYSLDMESVCEIQQEQVDNGNDEFRVIVSEV